MMKRGDLVEIRDNSYSVTIIDNDIVGGRLVGVGMFEVLEVGFLCLSFYGKASLGDKPIPDLKVKHATEGYISYTYTEFATVKFSSHQCPNCRNIFRD